MCRSGRILAAWIGLLGLCFELGCGSGITRDILDSTLLIKPGSPLLLLNQTAQLHVTASYANGTSADITSAAVWTVAAPSIASIDSNGLLTCKTAGFAQITAASEGVTAATGVNCSTLQLVISGIASLELVGQTTQLHVTASYANGTSADITSAAVWTVAAPSIASIDSNGLLTCKAAGSAQVSATSSGATATASVTCSQLNQIRMGATPTVVRSNSPYQYQLFADFSDGTTTDVTASAIWVADPSIASLSAGLLSCNNPGTTSLSVVFSGMTLNAPVTCILQSITPKPGFTESAETFDGPFQSWVNVKTAFGAKGDGVTDDAPALQQALDSLLNNPAVLWLPAGNYIIKSHLHLQGLGYFTILGEDPKNTLISWYGSIGETMLTLDGCSYFNLGRITWDGRGSAGTAIDVMWSQQGNYYPTHNFIHDGRIFSAATGIHLGFAGETTIERIHFDHNLQAGISLGTYNTLNINVVDSLFTDNAFGITNTYGAGAFNVTSSIFVRSTVSDIGIGNTGPFSIRNSLSVDSKMFFTTGEAGAPANIIIQGNTIDHPHSDPIDIGIPAPVMLLDNRFLHLDPSFHILNSFCNSPIGFISVGNTYSVSQPFAGNIGRYTSIDETSSSSDSDLSTTIPSEVYIPPFSKRKIFDLPSGSSADMIQGSINAAIAAGGGVVHIPAGSYPIMRTLEVTPDSSIAILGDGPLTNLFAAPSLQGPVLRGNGKTLQVENIQFYASPTDAAIELDVADRPSTRVFCDECATVSMGTSGLEVDGLDDASIELKAGLLNSSGTLGAIIHGGRARQNGSRTLGRVSGFLTGTDAYQVDLGGYFLDEDGWHDAGQGGTQFSLTGEGTVTQQGGTIYSPSSSYPSMTLTNYSGNLSLLAVATNTWVNVSEDSPSNVFVAGTLQTTGQSPIRNLEPSAKVAELVNFSTPNNYVPTELADTVVTSSYIEHMLAMARTDYLVRRAPLVFDATTVRLTRIFASGGEVGIRLSKITTTSVGGSYSIKPIPGSMAASQGSCEPGEISMTGTWTLQDGGDGFFGMSRAGALLSEDTTAHGDGNGVTLVNTMSSARDRWILEQVGDGSVTIVNRATGNVLTRASEGCAYSTNESTDADQHWLVDSAN
jgi:Pectate lyase superfamily protein/Bacterial Ig-like domain (group 2)